MNKSLRQIGIVDDSFELVKVSGLIKRGVIDQPLDGNHGEMHPKGEDFVEAGVPFIMASDINNGRVDYSGCKFITAKQADSLRKGFAKNGDVLVTHKASVGRTAIVNYTEHPFVMLTPQVTYYRVLKKEVLDNRYLLHYFDSSLFQQTINMWAGAGSTRAYLGITAQHNLPIIVPPIDKQKKIAAILSAYDDLIENNKRRIALLEKMAEEIYREWFVRFRFPGYQDAEFEKGIPKGWESGKGEKFFSHVKGKSYKSEDIAERQSDVMPFVTLKSFNRGGGYREEGLKWYSGPFREQQLVKEGDVVMAVTDMTQEREVVGRVARVPFVGEKGAVISLDVIKLVPKTVSELYLYSYLKYSGFGDFIKTFANGANVLHLKPDLVTNQVIVVPPRDLRQKFEDIVGPLHEQGALLAEEVKVLAQTKEMLLPRLISGKLSVEDLDIEFPPSMDEVG